MNGNSAVDLPGLDVYSLIAFVCIDLGSFQCVMVAEHCYAAVCVRYSISGCLHSVQEEGMSACAQLVFHPFLI